MRRFAALTLVLAIAACGGDSTSPTVSLTGTYSLRTVNGSQLPVTFSDGTTLVSDMLTLSADGTFSDDAQFSDGSVEVEQGFWTSSNGAIAFQDANSTFTFQGSLSGSVLTEVVGSLVEVYQKN
jgi:hypothetical protein